MKLNLSISTNDRRCPPGNPVAVIDDDTGDLMGCYRSTVDAVRAKTLFEAGPNIIATSTSPTIAW